MGAVVGKAGVLVAEHDEQRVLPVSTAPKGLADLEYERLAGTYIGGQMIVVRARVKRVQIDEEIGVDPRTITQSFIGALVKEANW